MRYKVGNTHVIEVKKCQIAQQTQCKNIQNIKHAKANIHILTK